MSFRDDDTQGSTAVHRKTAIIEVSTLKIKIAPRRFSCRLLQGETWEMPVFVN